MDAFLIVGVACGFKKLKGRRARFFVGVLTAILSHPLPAIIFDRNGFRFPAADQRNQGGESQVPPPEQGGMDEPHRGRPAFQVLGLNHGHKEEQHLGRPCGERQEGVYPNGLFLLCL